jgi:hypothetical protein
MGALEIRWFVEEWLEPIQRTAWNQKSTKHSEKRGLRGSQSQGPQLLRIEPKKPFSSSSFLVHVVWYVESVERQNDLLMDDTNKSGAASRWMRRNQHTSSDVSCLTARWTFGVLTCVEPYPLSFVFGINWNSRQGWTEIWNFDSSRGCWGHNTIHPQNFIRFQSVSYLVNERVLLPLDVTGWIVKFSGYLFVVRCFRQPSGTPIWSHEITWRSSVSFYLMASNIESSLEYCGVYISPECYITNNSLFIESLLTGTYIPSYPWKNPQITWV